MPRPRTPDPLIDEIRAIREERSAAFGNDVRRLGEDAAKLQDSLKAKVIPAPKRPLRGPSGPGRGPDATKK
ncbi:MAG: hypothetical protein KGS45_09735 [Planctomycetes bacterium]|nr:hypothetical protein [Planctomycetota bacterium]